MERKQIYWEDMEEGQEIPSSYSLDVTWTKIAHYCSGSQDFYPVHHDPGFARAHGHKEMFVMTRFMEGCFSHLIHDWIGDEGFLRKFHMEMRRMNILGDTMTLKGKVTKKYVENSNHLIDADVWCENPREGITTPCRCTVVLPSRS